MIVEEGTIEEEWTIVDWMIVEEWTIEEWMTVEEWMIVIVLSVTVPH